MLNKSVLRAVKTPLFLCSRRNFSYTSRVCIIQKAKDFNQVLNKIGDESSQESQKTMKVIRKIGGFSIVVVLCSILWASVLEESEVVHTIETIDLSKDIRDRANRN